jgi:hypothetical protein
VGGVTYDAGVLIAAERGDDEVWKLHGKVLDRGERPTVPAVVLAQAWRRGNQARLVQLLKTCVLEAVDEGRARAAGIACGRARTSDVVDAIVVVSAASRGDVVVTSDPDDIHHLAVAFGARLQLIPI